jgi:hypothetical protein
MGFLNKCEESFVYTECPTHYQTWHFFNNSNKNEEFEAKFEQEYVLFFNISYTMRKVSVRFLCNILNSGKIIKEMPGSVASGTLCITRKSSIQLGPPVTAERLSPVSCE